MQKRCKTVSLESEVEEGRRLFGMGDLKRCIDSMKWAISSYEGKPNASHSLAVCHCLIALCSQSVQPTSKDIAVHIKDAISLWLGIVTGDDRAPTGEMIPEDIMLLLYNVADLLSIKGCVEVHNDMHRLMLRLFKLRRASVEKCVAKLWECRRMNHALCYSPVSDAFMKNLEAEGVKDSDSIKYWLECLNDSKPGLLAFQHIFSFLFPNFLPQSSFRLDIKISEVEEAAMKLTSSSEGASINSYMAGYMFYELSDRVASNGCLLQALEYAQKDYELREELLNMKLTGSDEQKHDRISLESIEDQRNIISMLQKAVAREVCYVNTRPVDLESCYLSPWNAFQCFLESTLQVGLLEDMVGKARDALSSLRSGQEVSNALFLPQFVIVFSTALGKVYHKLNLWDLALTELQACKKYLVVYGKHISCSKCYFRKV